MKDKISNFEELLKIRFTDKQINKIMSALHWAEELHTDQTRASGEPYLVHPLMVSEILVDFNMDFETIIGGLLHDVIEDTVADEKDIEEKFGKNIARLVYGVTKISLVESGSRIQQSSETIRKTLFAMTEDIRVIIIKLADKYHNMTTLHYLNEERKKRIAQECLEIYAPLAERLGIAWLKAELEDLSLKHLNPVAWQHIIDNLELRQAKRDEFLKKVSKTISGQAKKEHLSLEIQVRAKHIYSIYLKMKKQKKEIDEMFDLLGVRLICKNINECYTILGMVHSIWPPIEGRFKDYIAMPKANRYQSLHTTVMSFDGQLLEIQIRTDEMHARAEFGIAAHWAYKKGLNHRQINPDELLIINKLKDWNANHYNSVHFLDEIKEELLKDSIYIFTPDGQIVELPKGATAIDFAYHIHTEVGNHCIGARSQSAMITLDSPLKNTDVIEIMTSPNARPHSSWLKIAKTSRAKSKIRHWLLRHDENVLATTSIIAKNKADHIADEEKIKEAGLQRKEEKKPSEAPTLDNSAVHQFFDQTKLQIRVGDETNMMIKMAGCCHPVPGDPIVGYVSRGRGIIVHNRSCTNLANIPEVKERLIAVEWATDQPKKTIRFNVLSKKIPDLFSQIDGAIRKLRGHLIQGRVEENDKGNLIGSFLIEVKKENDFDRIKRSIRSIPTVLEITQQMDHFD